jgi:hypothetical protein
MEVIRILCPTARSDLYLSRRARWKVKLVKLLLECFQLNGTEFNPKTGVVKQAQNPEKVYQNDTSLFLDLRLSRYQ